MQMKLKNLKSNTPTNVKIGSEWEKHICKCLQQYGFFAHNCINGLYGQPCDIIAINGGISLLLDSKHVKKGTRFDFKYIEPNQYNVFEKASTYNNIENCGFVIVLEEMQKLYYLPFSLVKANENYEKVSIDCTQLPTFTEQMNKWRADYENFNQLKITYRATY